MPIMTVTLHRLAACFPNGMFRSGYGLLLRSRCDGHVEDFLFQNCAMQIVHAVAERHLRERQSKADPISGQMIDIIQINAAHREIAKLLKRGGALDLGEDPMGLRRFESEGNQASESAGLILQFSELPQMIHPLSERFDVPVEHG